MKVMKDAKSFKISQFKLFGLIIENFKSRQRGFNPKIKR